MVAALALWAGAASASSGTLRVRSVTPAAALHQLRDHGLALHRVAMTPEEARIAALRAERSRALLPLKQLVMGKGLRIDRTLQASRRTGWVSRAPVSNPLQRTAASAAAAGATPPDTIRMALIRIDFLTDRGAGASSGDGHFDLSGPDTLQPPIDRAPHDRRFYERHAEALERYYAAQSYGRAVVEVDVWPPQADSAYHVSDMADFGPWKFSRSVYRDAVKMMRTMFFAADSQSAAKGQRIPWDAYDRFTIIHAGSDLQSDLRQDSPSDIPSFTVFVGDTDVVVFPDSLTRGLDRCAIVPETINQDGYFGALNGVLAHENGHNLFGFSDVYDVESGYPVVGYWSLMDSGNLVGSRVQLADGSEIFATGLLPPSIDPFQRAFLGDGLVFAVPAWGETLSVVGNERSPLMFQVPLSSDEYLLIENRFLAPADAVELDQDDSTRVILGPKSPDRFEYDALLPGGGILVWHVDASVIPFETALRPNFDYAFNSNPFRLGLQVIEADGLDDLGDGGSPYILGSPLDPYQRSINPSLSDTTQPNLRPNQGTRPHLRIDFLDDAAETMRFTANRTWQLAAWPVEASFPPLGPQLLAIDADGDRYPEVCWAGGDTASADSAALFAVRFDGSGINAGGFAFATLDRRPREVMAAILTGDPELGQGPAVFAVTTYRFGSDDTQGGRAWMVDHQGNPLPGWPVTLASPASTPPLIAGVWPSITVFVGCEDGRVRGIGADGTVRFTSSTVLTGGVSGRLAFDLSGFVTPIIGPAYPQGLLAAGGAGGEVAVFDGSLAADASSSWPHGLGVTGIQPDFLWLRFTNESAQGCVGTQPSLVVRAVDRLWAFCAAGQPLPGWGQSLGDTLVAGLGAGDPDGDGFPEVLIQTQDSRLAFINQSGHPSPGWPKQASDEPFRTTSPPLTVDLDGDRKSEVLALNASGVLVALKSNGRTPEGFPLATGAGAKGSAVLADLDRDGTFELVAPDRFRTLYGYSLPIALASDPTAIWLMLGGDPQRTSSLPASRTPVPLASAPGPLERGSLKAFPNPARNSVVKFAYTLSEAAEVQFSILDASGHEVASFARSGQRAENLEIWDPGALPAGLYIARLRFNGARGEQKSTVSLGLLR
ncbi:MAG: immune inhibitor A domain-containing protein [Candidatus Eisenbacteria bacterium]